MKTIRSLTVIGLLLLGNILFYACKKENGNSEKTPEMPDCRILTINSGSAVSQNITYNTEGKVATITEMLSGFTIVKNFQYSGNMIVIRRLTATNNHQLPVSMQLIDTSMNVSIRIQTHNKLLII